VIFKNQFASLDRRGSENGNESLEDEVEVAPSQANKSSGKKKSGKEGKKGVKKPKPAVKQPSDSFYNEK